MRWIFGSDLDLYRFRDIDAEQYKLNRKARGKQYFGHGFGHDQQ
jgi:hypothetical protein